MSEQANADVTTTQNADSNAEATAAESKDGVAAESKANAKEAETENTQAAEKVVPEKYELKSPEGSFLDQARLDKIAQFAKEQKMSAEEAQSIVDNENGVIAQFVEGQKLEFEKQTQAWFEECKNDKDVGGVKFKENAEIAKRAIEHLFPKEINDILNDTGWGNHPALFKGFVKLGQMLSDDKLILPQNQSGGQKSAAELIYGSNKN